MSRPEIAELANSARGGAGADRAVRVWLICVACLVFAMVVIGGATRLTDSGLSITEWLPLLGAIPPMSDGDWAVAFEKYKQIPEYKEVNAGMSLAAFKSIYWWEWSHRFLGRFIGVAFAVPFAVFYGLGMIRRGFGLKLFAVFLLGGLQGFIGWYMVQSGLVERVDVSHYRLALHLSVAFLILSSIVWLVLALGPAEDDAGNPTGVVSVVQQRVAWGIVGLVLLQVVLGAFVAGTKAGLGYNTWPLMDGQFVPDGLFAHVPWYLDALENVIAIQFNHRLVAYVVLLVAGWHALSLWCAGCNRRVVRSGAVLASAIAVQAVLGIWTLLSVPDAGGIPIGLGLVHQGGAAVVMVIAVWHLYLSTQNNFATR